jgi:phosphopantetheine adenylyltransferase
MVVVTVNLERILITGSGARDHRRATHHLKYSGDSFNSCWWIMCSQETNVVLRGLRAISDFEYEFRGPDEPKLDEKIEAVFMMPAGLSYLTPVW